MQGKFLHPSQVGAYVWFAIVLQLLLHSQLNKDQARVVQPAMRMKVGSLLSHIQNMQHDAAAQGNP
jgi:hypothetical protein